MKVPDIALKAAVIQVELEDLGIPATTVSRILDAAIPHIEAQVLRDAAETIDPNGWKYIDGENVAHNLKTGLTRRADNIIKRNKS